MTLIASMRTPLKDGGSSEPFLEHGQSRLPKRTAHEAMVTGRRYTAEQAEAAGIVQRTAAEDEVLPAAVEWAASLAGKNGKTVGKIRADLYRPALDALNGPPLP